MRIRILDSQREFRVLLPVTLTPQLFMVRGDGDPSGRAPRTNPRESLNKKKRPKMLLQSFFHQFGYIQGGNHLFHFFFFDPIFKHGETIRTGSCQN